MSTINQLNAVDSPGNGDLIALYVQQSGDVRKISVYNLAQYVLGLLTASDKVKQYSAPTTTGFSVTISDKNTWLILTPTGTLAAGTIVLPDASLLNDGSELLCNSTQTVTTLTINANGSSAVGMPTTIAAGGFFRLKFDKATSTWYRV